MWQRSMAALRWTQEKEPTSPSVIVPHHVLFVSMTAVNEKQLPSGGKPHLYFAFNLHSATRLQVHSVVHATSTSSCFFPHSNTAAATAGLSLPVCRMWMFLFTGSSQGLDQPKLHQGSAAVNFGVTLFSKLHIALGSIFFCEITGSLWKQSKTDVCGCLTSPLSFLICWLNSLPSRHRKSSPGSRMPHLVAMARAVLMLSPVTMRTVIPARWHLEIASGTWESVGKNKEGRFSNTVTQLTVSAVLQHYPGIKAFSLV